jgi:HPt (histidine-containing phosphotransfer) domain-containing protein
MRAGLFARGARGRIHCDLWQHRGMQGQDPPQPSGGMAHFQQVLAKLSKDFAAQLPARLAQADALLAACQAVPEDPAPLEELHRMLHTLAGNAGTFGHAALGTKAREAEHVLAPLVGREGRTAADFAPVIPLLGEIAALAPKA